MRVARKEDKCAVNALLETLIRPLTIEEQFREAVDCEDSPYRAYVFLNEYQVVGCAVITEEAEHEYLEINYNLEAWINTKFNKFGMYGSMEHFVLAPMFARHQAFCLRELHRLSNFYVLFYRLKRYEYMFTHKNLPITGALPTMAPVPPKHRPEYDKRITEEYQLPEALLKKHQPFALYLTTTRTLSAPKVEINHKIVVIGAGDTAIAFLESLLFSPKARSLVGFEKKNTWCT